MAWALAGSRCASAITIRNDVSDSLYISLGAESAYASVGFVDVLSANQNLFGSGVLIAPDWVLTAAHVVTVNGVGPAYPAADVSFGQGASTTPYTPADDAAANVEIDPAYTGDFTKGNDLALIQLSTPILNVAPAALYSGLPGSELGLTATVVGYGYGGNGLTGDTGALGNRQGMQNVIDAFGGQVIPSGALGAYSSDLMFTDFDTPNTASASFVNVMGSSTPLGLEGGVTPGDSGGGAFVTVNGQNYLAGIVDFEANLHTNPTGKYGDYDGYVRVSAADTTNFLDSVLATSSSWSQSSGGSWASLNCWSVGCIPEFAGASANFGGAIGSPSSISLDGVWTAGTVTFNNTNSYTLVAGTGGALTLNNGGAAATAAVIDNGGSHFIDVPVNLTSNVLIDVANSGDVLTISGPLSGEGGVTIGGRGTVRLGMSSGTTAVSSLVVQSGATLDISNNTLAINFGAGADPVAAIRATLSSAYSGGSWTGMGISSSTAAAGKGTEILSVGYADGNADSGTAAGMNQILVKYTLAGDANLDGEVNFTDLGIVGQHLNTTGNDWAHGNFTYDAGGAVTFADLGIVGQNLNKLLTPAGSSAEQVGNSIVDVDNSIRDAAVEVPEPTFVYFGGMMCGAALCGRRRKRAGAILLGIAPAESSLIFDQCR